jgi:hypothetical protein
VTILPLIYVITLIKENPKEIEPKSITDFEVPELAIDFEESEPISDFKNRNPLGI